ncbi:MAG TPA: hypothetical protein VGC55_16175 [Dokdonella sp.]
MIGRVQAWLARRRRRREAIRQVAERKNVAIEKAVAEFRRVHATRPMGARILKLGADTTIVRVMYLTTRRPPDRAWYAVSHHDNDVRELSYADAARWERTPWR